MIEVSFGEEPMAESAAVIKAAFECEDLAGKRIAIAPMELTPQGGFRQSLRLTPPPGYYRLTCRPTATGPSGAYNLQPVTISFAVLGEPAGEALAVPA